MAVMLSELKNDPRKYRLDKVFFKRVWMLARPYWTRKGAWKSWLVVAFLVAMMGGYSLAGAYFTKLTADVTNALVDKKTSLYWELFSWLTICGLLRFGADLIQQLASGLLYQDWWHWLTGFMVDNYLQKQTYYHIAEDEKIDNPDQRIQEEIEPFCSTVGAFPQQFIGSLMDMSVQTTIMMSISSTMFFAVIGFTLFQAVTMYYINKPTIKQNFDVTVAEADLRYGMTHIRNNSENIAFYGGETIESQHMGARLNNVIKKQMRAAIYSGYMGIMNEGVSQVWNFLPLIVLVPLYFRGDISYGTIGQATASATMLLNSLSVLNSYIPQLTLAVPNIVRMSEVHEKFLEVQRARQGGEGYLTLREGKDITLKDVSLKTPGGEQTLITHLNLEVNAHSRLVIVGRTGTGKSSLLRAIAGLWYRGEGEITVPQDSHSCLFLPQRPYTFLGDLRSQICYPAAKSPVSDEQLAELLRLVCLEGLIERQGGLDSEKDWSRTLSLGEQQRLGFARLLLAKPRYAFLDEATSALDHPTEATLYQQLEKSGIAYISIGHRDSLMKYHQQALCLEGQGKWQLLPAAEVSLTAMES